MMKFGDYAEDFEDDQIRHAFICKVLSILGIQLGITAAIVLCFVLSYDLQRFAISNRYILYICIGVKLFVCIALVCCDSVARSVPINYILLMIFTLCEGYAVGFVASLFEPVLVVTAVAITAVLCLGLSVFAAMTCCDFTVFRGIMLVFLIVFLCITIVCIFFPSKTLMFIICGLGIIIFGIMLIIDIQMMIGGNHKNQYSPDDYIVAALSIYVDIINLFLYILMLLGLLDS